MLTGRILVGIAACPQCGGEVLLDEATAEAPVPHEIARGDETTGVAPDVILASPVYRLEHCAPGWGYRRFSNDREVVFVRHRWDADGLEIRRVLAVELGPTPDSVHRDCRSRRRAGAVAGVGR